MDEKLKPCPQCTRPMIGIDYRENIGFVKLYCKGCDLCMSAARFVRRTPGPATAAMVKALETKPAVWLTTQEMDFLAEHVPAKGGEIRASGEMHPYYGY